MITIGLAILFGVAVIAAIGNGEIGPAVMGIVIIILIFSAKSSMKKDMDAWHNRREYWARGGPDRDRRR